MTSYLKKASIGGMAALSLAAAMISNTAPARAGDGGAVAAGVIGGLAVGAIAGSAIANSRPYGYPAYGPGYAPAYATPAYGSGCYFTREPVYDAYGEVIGRRRVRVCE